MAVYANETHGSITLTEDGRHRTLTLEDAQELLEERNEAVEAAKEQAE
ncbi:hypothetical protein [Haloarcula nitratireducens]|uniref:Uncharacterized protein n=1 Tax=Haloarcula nitratireducens TaxID=2487749 RepID=A0AAW4PJ84_9EURY|nr:hypothetical protein [Halomicroarcula nitratireducens]MBX0298028.1 hypothetical protein [Halomicroarcula nitratireducens]